MYKMKKKCDKMYEKYTKIKKIKTHSTKEFLFNVFTIKL